MNQSGKKLAIGAAVLAALVALALWSRASGASEGEIRALVADCVRAAESRQVDVLVDAMAEDFKGPGNAPREGVKTLLTFLLKRPDLAAVFNPELSVTVSGDLADFSGKFVFARAKAKSFAELPPEAVISRYQFDGKLLKVGGKWRFVSANSREL